MTGNQPPAFQAYPRDFVGDLDVAALDLEQVGFYWMLLCYSWMKDGLPDDFSKISRALRISTGKFQKLWTVVGEKFYQDEEGKWRNERQEEEREKQRKFREERSIAGQRGNAKRYGAARSAVAQPSLSHRSALANSRSAFSSSTAVCTPQPPVGGNASIHSDSIVPDGVAAEAYQQWRKAWEASGRKALPLEPRRREADHCIAWVSRYPEADWRALQLRAFFESDNPKVRASPPSLGWFVTTWADEIDKALRDKGHRPASEAAA